jgi:hypothetical protein
MRNVLNWTKRQRSVIRNMAMNGLTCTCFDHPHLVDVASNNHYYEDDDDRVGTRQGLLHNLQHFGWSPLRILVDPWRHGHDDEDDDDDDDVMMTMW